MRPITISPSPSHPAISLSSPATAVATKERAGEIAAQIAAMPPQAIQAAKRLMRAGRTDDYSEHVHRALLQLLPMFRTKDFAESVAAFFEKRDPNFLGE